jgi:hypothetical protein
MLPRILATRFVTPLSEGGSLPGIVEADDFGTYVVKFRGAGQGLKVLVAEVVVAGIGRHLGLRIPELAAVVLGESIAKYEADEEVQDLLNASLGLNLAVDFLPGSFGWDPHLAVDPELAARILWLDAFTANVDRTYRNPNVLVWHRQLWLIDHGAALYFHHSWNNGAGSPQRFADQPYDATLHIMSPYVAALADIDSALAREITRELLTDVLNSVPDEWLEPVAGLPAPPEIRAEYVRNLLARVSGRRPWLPKLVAA